MALLATLSIPALRSWEKNTNGYQLFRAGLGYLHIKPVAQGFELSLRPDMDGTAVGQPQHLTYGDSPTELADLAKQEFHGAYRATLVELKVLGYDSHQQAHRQSRLAA
jgi:hypothetical protein